jgi:nucleolar protein 56
MQYQFTHLLGTYLYDDKSKKLEALNQKSSKPSSPKGPVKNSSGFPEAPPEKVTEILALFREKSNFPQFHEKNIQLTKEAIRRSVDSDQLIIQAVSNLNELDKTTSLLIKRLREWSGLYFPELSEKVSSHEKFVELFLGTSKKDLLHSLGLKDSMGGDLSEEDLQEITLLGKEVSSLYALRSQHEKYLENLMKKYCPNLLELAGITIGAKLLELSKGLKNLALLPSSTIQLLGAEKALFRHLKSGNKSPKYGVLFQHPLVQNAHSSEKGKAARMLADKLSLCARLDYFKGEFKAKEYKTELEEKLK